MHPCWNDYDTGVSDNEPNLIGFPAPNAPMTFRYSLNHKCIWVRSRNCGCLVTWFCYQLIAKPGNKTAAVPWPEPYANGGDLNEQSFSKPRSNPSKERGLNFKSYKTMRRSSRTSHSIFKVPPDILRSHLWLWNLTSVERKRNYHLLAEQCLRHIYLIAHVVLALAWWRHEMETFPPLPVDFLHKEPAMRTIDSSFDVRLNKLRKKNTRIAGVWDTIMFMWRCFNGMA